MASVIEYNITYGDQDAPYALYVHEGHILYVHGHRTSRHIPPNKFLESAVVSKGGQFIEEKVLGAFKRMQLI